MPPENVQEEVANEIDVIPSCGLSETSLANPWWSSSLVAAHCSGHNECCTPPAWSASPLSVRKSLSLFPP